jgi:hypothetical protein
VYPDNLIIAANGRFKLFKNISSANNPFFCFTVKKTSYADTCFEKKKKDVVKK